MLRGQEACRSPTRCSPWTARATSTLRAPQMGNSPSHRNLGASPQPVRLSRSRKLSSSGSSLCTTARLLSSSASSAATGPASPRASAPVSSMRPRITRLPERESSAAPDLTRFLGGREPEHPRPRRAEAGPIRRLEAPTAVLQGADSSCRAAFAGGRPAPSRRARTNVRMAPTIDGGEARSPDGGENSPERARDRWRRGEESSRPRAMDACLGMTVPASGRRAPPGNDGRVLPFDRSMPRGNRSLPRDDPSLPRDDRSLPRQNRSCLGTTAPRLGKIVPCLGMIAPALGRPAEAGTRRSPARYEVARRWQIGRGLGLFAPCLGLFVPCLGLFAPCLGEIVAASSRAAPPSGRSGPPSALISPRATATASPGSSRPRSKSPRTPISAPSLRPPAASRRPTCGSATAGGWPGPGR